jgi:chromobox protein 1
LEPASYKLRRIGNHASYVYSQSIPDGYALTDDFPALPSDENASNSGSESEEIPFRKAKAAAITADSEDEDDDDEAPDEYIAQGSFCRGLTLTINRYVVEKIVAHNWSDEGVLLFKVKWQGYPNAADQTWEGEENLKGLDALSDYYKKIGGRPEYDEEVAEEAGIGRGKGAKAKAKGKTPRKRTHSESAGASPPETGGKGRKKRANGSESPAVIDVKREKNKYPPPAGESWEKYVLQIDTIHEVPSKTGIPSRTGYVQWIDGTKSKHRLDLLHEYCPKKVGFYFITYISSDRLTCCRCARSIRNTCECL